jgi:microcystin-dependent protein
MASTYSPNLRLELITTGEQQGTWGSTTNTNLGTLLEEAIGGYVSVTVSDVADTTLTTSNGSADQSRNMVINLAGALTATRNVICPAIEKLYVVKNATTGGQSVVFKVSGQTGVTVPNGIIEFIYVDGTDARSITGSIAIQDANNVAITGGSITGITDLAVADGGTGASNAASARTNLGIGTIGTQNANAVAITGGTVSGVTVSNTSISNVSVIANASSLSVRDSDGSNILSIAVGSNLTANTILTLTTGATSNRTLDISASNVTISTAGAALIDDADASAQRTTLGIGTIATQNANAVAITGGTVSGATVSNSSLSNVSVIANASSLSVRDSDGSNILSIAVGSNLTANTVLTLTTGATSNRTLDISASNVTVSVAGAALIDDADASAQRTTLGIGTIATQNANAVSITGGSVTGITDLALADGGTGASLVDPNANAVLGWNDTANVMGFFTAGTGVTINATSNTISSSAASIIPVGSLMPYAGTSAPTGWTLCFGQAVSRTTFADLFAVVGTTYGIGDGSTTFNLPDLRGRVVAGKDDMGGTSANRLTGLSGGVNGDVLGAAGGAEIHTLTTAEMPSHTHTITYGVNDVNGGGGTDPSYLESTGRTETTNATGGGGAHNNVQPTFILNYIIKN